MRQPTMWCEDCGRLAPGGCPLCAPGRIMRAVTVPATRLSPYGAETTATSPGVVTIDAVHAASTGDRR